jgi:2,5-dihydroxypyridine 5,6-dioxygenase
MNVDFDLLSLFRAQLELCKVGPGQTVVVLTEDNARADYAQAFLAAAQLLGASAMQVNVPRRPSLGGVMQNFGKTSLAGNRAAIEALKRADLVIDLMLLLFSDEQVEITRAGARMLLVVEPPEVLRRMFPTEELRHRVEHGESLLSKARTLRVSSKAGTDVTYRLGQYPVVTEYGYTDQPGRWDHWPSGFLFTHGDDDGVDGTVVIDRGDIICAFRRYVQQPVTLRIAKGRVVRIEGGGLDAELLRDYMAGFDEKAYAVSHIGWGLNHRAQWHHMAVADPQKEIGMDALAFHGNVLFSTGPNTELGGSNDTPCHVDIPLRNCSLWLDDLPILSEGRMVNEAMKAPSDPSGARP